MIKGRLVHFSAYKTSPLKLSLRLPELLVPSDPVVFIIIIVYVLLVMLALLYRRQSPPCMKLPTDFTLHLKNNQPCRPSAFGERSRMLLGGLTSSSWKRCAMTFVTLLWIRKRRPVGFLFSVVLFELPLLRDNCYYIFFLAIIKVIGQKTFYSAGTPHHSGSSGRPLSTVLAGSVLKWGTVHIGMELKRDWNWRVG